MLKRKKRLPALAGALMLMAFGFLIPKQGVGQVARTIKGAVLIAADRTPLPGVSIAVNGINTGATTNESGNYTIQAKPTDLLVFSFIGFNSQEVVVGNRTSINILLVEDVKALNQVVVIGYGAVQKSDLTGSVSQLKVDEMAKAPVASFAEALAGRVAGVQVASPDGQPGAGMDIIIRGAGSLTQSTAPLYIIDGFPVEDINSATLNPEDIESMSILKDASSTAIYGSRGANGVVVIETKRGKIGKPIVNYSSSYGFQDIRKTIEVMSPYEFVKYNLELSPTNASVKSYIAGEKTLDTYKKIGGVNWQDHIFQTGQVQIHNVSLRGGTEQTKYAVSGSIFDQKGVVINTGLNRHTARVTIDQTINPRIKLGLTGNYSGLSSFGQVLRDPAANSVSSTVLFRTWGYRPVTPNIADDAFLEVEADIEDGVVSNTDVRINPFIDLENQYQKDFTNLLDGNAFISYQITKELMLKVTGGVRRNSVRYDRFFNSKTSQGSPNNPLNSNGVNGSVRYVNSNSWSNEYILNYKKSINNKHNITGLLLAGLNEYETRIYGYGGRLLPNESLNIFGLEEGLSYNPAASYGESSLASLATRWDYNYKSKYMFTVNLRADGSSKFINEKWGIFPGAAIAWNMTREDFFKDNLAFISNSKLRFSYGTNGNNRIGDFSAWPSLVQVIDGYSFNNGTPMGSVYMNNVGNPDTRWEKTTQFDAGYELGLFKNRISVEIDLYRKTTRNLLLSALLPPSTGFANATKNIGSLKNEGFEFTINTINLEKRAVTWRSNLNISFNRNEILALTLGQRSLGTVIPFEVNFGTPLYLAEIGRQAGLMYGFVWQGNYQLEDFNNPSEGVYILKPSVASSETVRTNVMPGDVKYLDVNGDGWITDMDKTIIGRGQPIHTGGFSNNFGYKGFSLNVFLQWAYGNDVYNANRISLEGNTNRRVHVNQYASYVNRWTPENPTNENWRSGGQGVIGRHSSKFVEDGSYLRLKTVSLEYSLPKKHIAKYLSNLSLNVSSQNLWTWTNYSGLDPEASTKGRVLSPGFDFSAYPQARTLVLGLKAAY